MATLSRGMPRRLGGALDVIDESVAYYDAFDRLQYWNASHAAISQSLSIEVRPGITYREQIDNLIERGLFPKEARDEHLLLRRTSQVETEYDLEDGGCIRVKTSVTPDGGVIMITVDVTAEKQYAAKLAVALEAAETANQIKSVFLATMSHEIRTPLNGVLGMAQAMDADTLSRAQRDRLNVIRSSGETLLAILNDVLDLSKIEAGKFEIELVDFDLRQLAQGAYAAFTAVANKKDLSFKLNIDPAADGAYRGDATRIRQILYNIISNALKFTETGSVVVDLSFEGTELKLAVVDTGIGIAPDRRDALFSRFTQADASITRKYGGTGLGLAICMELTRLMGGYIDCDSREGVGTTFTVTLPLERIGALEVVAADAPRPSREYFESSLRVLAAEDNQVNQLVLKTLLHQVGIDPVVVGDGAQAVQAWADGDWDLILMDMQMPVMDGLSATEEIRRREVADKRRRIPIIALTANVMANQVQDYLANGIDTCVAKPIQVDSLFRAIEAVVASDEAAMLMDHEHDSAAVCRGSKRLSSQFLSDELWYFFDSKTTESRN